ncbi:hypothetical protein OESDEN_00010 [Oesophagostomum dentatum]|uniref:MICOS complex subunit MIC60 n=1 Tax=Oesophagostomum dentatum TaxID=61180 RepID=A0A0B1TVL4_OESDE|nr:hypothetical protein OESDEN_00010 [Oesophagostomum dentatum]
MQQNDDSDKKLVIMSRPTIKSARVTKKSLEQGLKGIRTQATQATPTPPPPPHVPKPPPKRGGGRKVALTVGTLAAATGGVVGYAYMDPEFRQKLEATVPQVKPALDAIMGSDTLSKAKQHLEEIKEQVVSVIPKKKTEEVLPPLARVPLPEIERKPPVHVDPVDLNPPQEKSARPTPEVIAERSKRLESSLMAAIRSAEAKVRDATDAKVMTINAINDHAHLVKATVDDPQKADWEKVTSALQHAESLAHKDGLAEADGRNYIDNLRKVISFGKNDPATANNALLINATETANKLSHQLDELNGLVSKARQESTILNQYKDLIERSRQQFALEMRSILPNVDVKAKDKNLTEDELNALIAHAHLKVDHLRRQLSEQQVREEQHIAHAIAEQREADERIAAERLRIEMQRIQQQQDVAIERAVLKNRSTWETELEEQLKRTAAAHSEHLEQAVKLERDLHSRQVGAALSRLEGIESALSSRIALDSENRRAKQFWIACHNLIETIKHGNKAGEDMEQRRFPLEESLSLLKQCECEDAFVDALIAAFPKESRTKGVYTEQDLKNRFKKIYKLGRRTAAIHENGGTLTAYLWSYVRSMLLFDLPRKFSDDDMIDPENVDNLEVRVLAQQILARAKWYVERNDFDGAIRVSQLLRGEPALSVRDWLADARAYLETRLLAQLLVAHAAVSSIRSTY